MAFGLREGLRGVFHSIFLMPDNKNTVETVHPQIKNAIHFGTRNGGSTSLNGIDAGERFHSSLNSLSELILFFELFDG